MALNQQAILILPSVINNTEVNHYHTPSSQLPLCSNSLSSEIPSFISSSTTVLNNGGQSESISGHAKSQVTDHLPAKESTRMRAKGASFFQVESSNGGEHGQVQQHQRQSQLLNLFPTTPTMNLCSMERDAMQMSRNPFQMLNNVESLRRRDVDQI